MEFGKVFRLKELGASRSNFIVMVIHPTERGESPQSILLANDMNTGYPLGHIANWSVYEAYDWEQVDDDK